VRSVIQLSTPLVGYVGVELGCRKIRMAQHFLNGSEVGAAFEQVGGEGVAQEVGVDARWVEPRLLGELAQDQEGAGPGERAAAGVQEQLRPVA
jgi:hypothetical protein